MKSVRSFLASGLLSLLGPCTAAWASPEDGGLQHLFTPPSDLQLVRNEVLASSYPGTECVDFSLKGSKEKVGFICSSKNKDFIGEMGIIEYDSLPESARPKGRPKSGLLVATPMAQYEMRSFASGKSEVKSAVVDCDTEGEVNYRATSTCHVAVSSLNAEEVIYSNFVLIHHTSHKRSGISQQRIKKLWRQLESR